MALLANIILWAGSTHVRMYCQPYWTKFSMDGEFFWKLLG